MNNFLPGFLAELSRRNVFRVAAAYVIVGWIVLQVVGLLAPNLGLPDWTVALVFILLLAGFPVAMLLTWAFELTPRGIERTHAAEGPVDLGVEILDLVLAGTTVLLIALTLVTGLVPGRAPLSNTPLQSESAQLPDGVLPTFTVAVLPFENFSDDKQLGWIADGISEDVLTQLAAFPRLLVAARNSSFQFKGTSQDLLEVGEALRVRYVLEGSLRMQGDALRVTAQLIETETGAHVWASQYNPALTEIAGLHDRVIDAIVTEVASTVMTSEYERLANIPEDAVSSEDLVHLSNRALNLGRSREAARLGALAIEKSPGSFRAHGIYGLSLAISFPKQMAKSSEEDVKQKIREEIRRVLDVPPQAFSYMAASYMSSYIGEVDPNLFYAKGAQGFSPDYPGVYTTLSLAELLLGNYEISLGHAEMCLEKANRIDPLAAGCHVRRAAALLALGRYDEALVAARTSYRLIDLPDARLLRLIALVRLGQVEEARTLVRSLPPNEDAFTLEEVSLHYRLIFRDKAFAEMQIDALRQAGLE